MKLTCFDHSNYYNKIGMRITQDNDFNSNCGERDVC